MDVLRRHLDHREWTGGAVRNFRFAHGSFCTHRSPNVAVRKAAEDRDSFMGAAKGYLMARPKALRQDRDSKSSTATKVGRSRERLTAILTSRQNTSELAVKADIQFV